MCYENKNLYANPFLLSGVTRKEQDIKFPVCTFGHHQKTLLTEEILFFSPKQLTPGWLPRDPCYRKHMHSRGRTGARAMALSSELLGAHRRRRGMICPALSLEKWKCRIVQSSQKWRKMIRGPFETRALHFYPTHFWFPFSCISSFLKILCCCFLKLCSSRIFTRVHV